MEHEPIKSMVGKKTKQIWEAYQEVLEELRSKEVIPSTTAVKEATKLGNAISLAESIDVSTLSSNLENMAKGLEDAKNVFNEISMAIDVKKGELKEVHKLETEVNSLTAIVAAKDVLVKEREELCRNLLTEAKEKAAELVDKSMKEASDIVSTTESESGERLEAVKKSAEESEKARKRQEQEWEYEFGRACKKRGDDFQDTLNAKLRMLETRREEIELRETKVDELDNKIDVLENTIMTNASTEGERLDAAIEEAKKKAKQSAAIEKTMVEKSYEAKLSIANARIEDQNGFIQELRERLNKAEDLVAASNERVTTIAAASMKAGADAATISRVSEIAAGAGSKK